MYTTLSSWVSASICCSILLFQALSMIVSISEFCFKLKEFNESIAILKLVQCVVFPVCSFKCSCSKTYVVNIIVFLSVMFVCDIYLCSFFSLSWKIFIINIVDFGHGRVMIILVNRFCGYVAIVTSLFKLCNEDVLICSGLWKKVGKFGLGS